MKTMKDITDEVRSLCEPDPRTIQEKLSAENAELRAQLDALRTALRRAISEMNAAVSRAADAGERIAELEAERDALRARIQWMQLLVNNDLSREEISFEGRGCYATDIDAFNRLIELIDATKNKEDS